MGTEDPGSGPARCADWLDGWPDRLRARVRTRGFASVRELAKQTEGWPLRAVADYLGEGDAGRKFAPVQLEAVMKGEAIRDGWVPWLVGDLLVRQIHGLCPDGWSAPATSQFMRIKATVFWTSALNPLVSEEAAELAGRRLLAEAAAGWEPAGADDPLIASIAAEALEPGSG